MDERWTREDFEAAGDYFARQYFYKNETEEWKDIINFGSKIPGIVRNAVSMVARSDNEYYQLFQEIMNEINELKKE